MFYVSRWLFAIVLYLILVLLILATKPAIMFDAQGAPKPFGVGIAEGWSVLALPVVLPALAILSYFLAAFLDLAMGSSRKSR